MGSVDCFGVKHERFGSPFAQGFSVQQQAMGVVNKSVQHGVGDSGIADNLVPVIDRHLAGDNG